jgi:hypothetical protein
MCKEKAVVLSWRNYEYQEIPQSGQKVSRPRFEPNISRIQGPDGYSANGTRRFTTAFAEVLHFILS